jgi:cation diffusion facilitator family transporter
VPREPIGAVVNTAVQVERRALHVSIGVAATQGAVGVVWGILARSQMILLDGVYAVVGIVLSWLLLRASSLAAQGPSRKFPYGREAATPMAIGVQGFVLMSMLVYAAVEAVYTIRDGGSVVTAGWALVYAVGTALVSVVTWLWLQSQAAGSDLLRAETAAWRVGALRGIGMTIGFAVLMVLDGSKWADAAPYVDPVMVLIVCVAFIGTPIRMVRTTVVELLEGAPPDDLVDRVDATVAEVATRYEIDHPAVRVTKLGSKLYVDVEAQVRPDVTVLQEHEVRAAVHQGLEDLPYEVWLNLELAPRPGLDRASAPHP